MTEDMHKEEGLVRLNKALAQSGVCARRKADTLIFDGAVTVNGVVVTEPGKRVNPEVDEIAVNGSVIRAVEAPCYLILHKPVHVVSTVSDPEGRSTVLDFVPEALRKKRLYPVGRLDYFSEGLLMLTDDGALANYLTHPRHHMPRTYRVKVRGSVSEQALETMRLGMTLSEGERLAKVKVESEPDGTDTVLVMTLHQGINRQIRRMCRDLGLTILKLVRVAMGPLDLGRLKPGEVRGLYARELEALHAPKRH